MLLEISKERPSWMKMWEIKRVGLFEHGVLTSLYLCSLEGGLTSISHTADPLPSKQLNPPELLSPQVYCSIRSHIHTQ